jgi:hypothetical protein
MNDDKDQRLLELRADEFHREGQPKKSPPDIYDGIAAIICISAFFYIKLYYFEAIKAWLFGG